MAALLGFVVQKVNQVNDKIAAVTSAASVATLVVSAAKGVTEGLGNAIGAVKCQKKDYTPSPQ